MKVLRNFVLLAGLSGGASAAEVRWIRLKSPNFEMYTTAGERSSRETLRYFEQVKGFFAQAMSSIPGKAQPVRIVAFSSKKEYEPYRLNNFANAYYHSSGTSEGIVLGDIGPDVFPVAIHEYVHLLVRHAGLTLPPWLDEGMAELYSTLKPVGDKIQVGNLIPGRFQALAREKWVPLEVIVGVDHRSPYYNEKNQAGSLYNEGWALTHMLVLNNDYRPGFAKFSDLVATGTSTGEALNQIYGKSIAQVDKELQGYLRGGHFQGVMFSQKLEKVSDEIPAEAAPPFDVKLILADLLNRPGQEKEARTAMEQLAAEEPKRPEPFAALGYLAWHSHRTDDAVENFGKAFALGGRDPGMLWDYGRLTRQKDSPASIRALSELIAQQPARVDARMELAAVQLVSKQSAAALETLKPVKKVTADEAPRLFALLAHAQLDSGLVVDARANAENLKKFAKTDEDKFQADRILQYLDESAKGSTPAAVFLWPSGETDATRPILQRRPAPRLVGEPPANAHKSIPGMFAELDCSAAPPRIVIETGDGRKVFLIDDPNKITGATIELNCGPQRKAAVRIDFIPAAQSGVDGLVRGIKFEP